MVQAPSAADDKKSSRPSEDSVEQLAESLEASDARIRAVLDAAVDSILTIDQRGNIESVNSATEKTFGYAPSELIGQNVNMLMPSPYHQEHDEYLSRYLTSGVKKIIGIGREVIGRRKDGSTFPLDLSVSEVILGNKRVFTGICRDITDRKLAESALLAERDRAELYLDAAGVLILSVDLQGRIALVNRKGCELLGKCEHEILGKEIGEAIFVPDEAPTMRKKLQDFLRGEGNSYHESKLLTSSGDHKIIAWYWTILREQGEIRGILASGTDISERVKAENLLVEAHAALESRVEQRTEELRLANEVLEASLKEKDVLLKEIHHRVKNNLQLISSLLNLQIRSGKATNTVDLVQEIRSRIQSIALLHEMLYQSGDLMHIDFGKYARTLAQNLIRYYGMASQVTLSVEADPVNLLLDSSMYCGLLLNELITNSLKHAFPVGRKGALSISMKRNSNDKLLLIVADTGTGLPKGFDLTKTSSLGLDLVQQLSAKLHGTLEIESISGTTFSLTFEDLAAI